MRNMRETLVRMGAGLRCWCRSMLRGFPNRIARIFIALCLLPGAALGQDRPLVEIEKVSLQDKGPLALPLSGSISEGQTIYVHIRTTATSDQWIRLKFKVDDDPVLDFLADGFTSNNPHQGVGDKRPYKREFWVPKGETTHTIKIDTKADPKKCRGGEIQFRLLPGDPDTDNRKGEYRLPTSTFGSARSKTIEVKDAGPCPTISIDPDAALERDGVAEGGAFDFTLKRINPRRNDPKVTLNWEVVDDRSRDFLPAAEQGRKSYDLLAYAIRDGGAINVEHDARVQTRFDPQSGSGTVTVKLLEGDYYLGTKTTLTVPVKDDPDYAGRVLSVPDLTVAEDNELNKSGQEGKSNFNLPMRLEGNIGTSAVEPSVRASFANGGGCQATATAQDLAAGSSGALNKTPRTNFPDPQVINWIKSNPSLRERRLLISLMNDEFHEGDEILCVRLDQPKGLKLPGGASEYFVTVTITDDDPAPTLSIDAPTVKEGDGYLYYKVTLTNPPDGKPVTLNYTDTKNGTAKSGEDYKQLDNGTITFPVVNISSAPREQEFFVEIIDDDIVEEDETVAVRFRQARNADFKDGARGVTVRGTITDNDSYEPEVRLREAAPGAGPVVVQEGETAVFHADIWVHEGGEWKIGTLDQDLVVSWQVASDPDAAATATGSDFPLGYAHPDSKDANIPRGESSVELQARTLSDSTEEPTETFRARLISARISEGGFLGAALKTTQGLAKGAIYDGPTLRIAAPKGPATEGGLLTFPVTLGMPAASDISVAWTTESLTSHTAEAGEDYTAASGTLVFKAGETDKLIVIETLEDGIDEPAEDFSVVLTDPNVTGLDLGPLRATGVVRDNDKRPEITIGDASATEGDTLTLPITLSPTPAVPVKLEWQIRPSGDYPATPGVDFTGGERGEITIAAGTASTNLQFPTTDDTTDEASETFEVALLIVREADSAAEQDPIFFSSNRARQQADILAPLTATATILDNDTPTMWIDDLEVTEGEKVHFTVRLSSPRPDPIEFRYKTEDGGGPGVPIFGGDRILRNDAKGSGRARDYTDPTRSFNEFTRDGWVTAQFPPGVVEAEMWDIEIVDDEDPESYSEYFSGIISLKPGADPDKVKITKDKGLARIVDNDTTRYWVANQNTTVREGRSVLIRVKRDPAGPATPNLYGCIEGTGPHTTPGHAGTHDIKPKPITPPGSIDVYTGAPGNAGSRCGTNTSDAATRAYFSFEADEDEASFWINTVNDSRPEPDETFIAWFDTTSVAGGRTAPQDAYRGKKVFTILDDDGIHRFRVVSANSPWEGEEAHFDIYVDSDAGLAALKAATNPRVLDFKVGADTDTAKQGVHYQQVSNNVNLDLSSVTSKSQRVGRVSIPTEPDEVLDGDKTLSVSFSEIFGNVSAKLPFRPAHGGGSATATIRDDEAYHLGVADTVADEGDDAIIPVRISKTADRDITVRFRTRAGTAKAPRDFTACTASDAQCQVTIPAGETEAQLRIPTTEDTTPERTEQFRVTIQRVDFADMIIDQRAAVVKIRDDDARSVAIAGLADASVAENEAWTSATPSTSGVPDGGLAWTLEGDDAAQFTIDPDTGVVTLPAQNFEDPKDTGTDNVYDITVRVTDEDGNAGTVELSVTVTDVVYGWLSLQAGDLASGDGDKVLSVDENTGLVKAEEGVTLSVPIIYGTFQQEGRSLKAKPRPAAAPQSAGFKWRASLSGTAVAGDIARKDRSAWLNTNWGVKTSSDVVGIADDGLAESAETFSVTFSTEDDDVRVSIWTGSKVIVSDTLQIEIVDNDEPGVTITPVALTLDEVDDAATQDKTENVGAYTVVLDSQPAAGTVTVAAESGDVAAATVSPASVEFDATNWNRPRTVTVMAVEDTIDNPDDKRTTTVTHTVTAAGEGTDYGGVTAVPVTVTVTDDDAAPTALTLTVDADTGTEGDQTSVAENGGAKTARVTATLAGGSTFATATTVKVAVGKSDDSATEATDYETVADQTITIPAGASSAHVEFTLTPTDDALHEGAEAISLEGAATGLTVTNAAITLADDDAAPTGITLSVQPNTIGEDDAETEFTVTATVNGTTRYKDTTTVAVSVGGGTATSGEDYEAVSSFEITIPAGDASATSTFDLTPTQDSVHEGTETIDVTGASGALTVTKAEISLSDDDAKPTATLVLTPASIAESGASSTSTVTATLSAASSQAVTLTVAAAPVAPALAADFTLSAAKTLTIAAGETESTGTVTVAANDNDRDAPDRTVTVSATASGGNGVAAPADVTLTITDDDDAPTVSVADATAVDEGDDPANTADMTFTVTLSGESGRDVTVPYTLGGTAKAGDDYTDPTIKSVTIDAGKTSADIVIAVKGDEVDEPNETVTVTLGTPTNATVSTVEGAGDASGTITDDDDSPTLSVNAPSVAEGDSGTANLDFVVTLSAESGQQVTVAYADTTTGTATSATDYTALAAGTLTFAPGTTRQTIRVAVRGDALDEANETVVLRLSAPVNAAFSGDATSLDATGTITDDDDSSVVSVADAAAVTEGNDPAATTDMTFTVTLSPVSGRDVTVPYTLGGSAQSPGDYTAPNPLSITISAGDSSGTITIPVKGDLIDEANETVTVTLGDPTNATLSTAEGAGEASGTITDDDARGVTVSKAELTLAEADDSATEDTKEHIGTYTVVLDSKPAAGTVTIAVESGDAKAATVSPPSLTFNTANWNTAQTVTVTAVADAVDNTGDERTATITHSLTAAGEGSDYSGVKVADVEVTITDDDTATLSIADATAAEGGTATFKVTLSAPSAGAVTVTATTSEGSATDPEDYAHKTQALTFAAGDTSKDFAVAIASDTVPELDETFTVTLSGATGAAIADGTATGTITGARSLLSVGDASAAEGGTLTFTVTRTGDTSGAVSAQWTTGDDPATDAKQATAGDDYRAQATAATLSFKAGDGSATITVASIKDAIDEPDETFLVTLSSPSTGVAFLKATGTGTITDDDDAPDGIELSVVPTSVAENAANAAKITVTATVTGGTTYGAETTVAVTVGDTDDTATSGEDYAAVTAFDIDIPAGAESATGSFNLDPADDAIAEGAEKLTVSGASGDIDLESAEVTITDDEATPTATLVLTPATIDESGASNSSTVTATLNRASSKDLTLTVSAGTGVTLSTNKTLTIDAGGTESEGTVTLTAINNDVDAADLAVTVSATATGGNGVANPANQTLTVRDDDARGVTVSKASLSVRETDDSATDSVKENEGTYTVVLDSKPAAGTVTVAVTSGDTKAATVSPARLTFNTANWSTAQAVTVTGVDDDTDNTDDKRTLSVTHVVTTTGTGNDYAALESADPVTVTVTDDDDAPGGIFLSVDKPSVGEGADATEVTVTATVTGTIRFAEAQTVVVSVGGGTATSAMDYDAVAAFNITIPAGEASATGTFDLTPTDDDVDEDSEAIDVTGALAGVTVTKATVTLTDDDTRGVTVTGSPLTISEADDAQTTDAKENEGTYTVVLTSRPTASVTINLSAGASAPVTLDKVSLTFAPDDWNTAQTVTVTAVDDAYDNAGDERAASITHTVVAGTSDYGSVTVDPVSVNVNDDDTAPSAIALTVDADTGTDGVQTSVAEGGGAKTVRVTATLAGNSRFPAAKTVVLAVGKATDSAKEGTDYTEVGAVSITIDANAASGSATFTLTPADDTIDDDAESLTVEGSVTGESGVTVSPASITIDDNDGAPTGIALSANPSTVAENAATAAKITITATVTGGTTFEAETTVAVTVGDADDTAVSDTDYAEVADFDIDIPPGATSATATFSLDPTDDAIAEGAEKLTVSGASGSIKVTDTEVTITDDEGYAHGDARAVPRRDQRERCGQREHRDGDPEPDIEQGPHPDGVGGCGGTGDQRPLCVECKQDFDHRRRQPRQYRDGDHHRCERRHRPCRRNGDGLGHRERRQRRRQPGRPDADRPRRRCARRDGRAQDPDRARDGRFHDQRRQRERGDLHGGPRLRARRRHGDGRRDERRHQGRHGLPAEPDVQHDELEHAAQTVTVTGVDDDTDNTDDKRTLSVTHAVSTTGDGNDYAALASADPVTVTVTDDDAAPGGISLSVDTPSVGEGAGATEVTVTATVTGATRFAEAQTVAVSVGGGTATSAVDYKAVAAFNITIPAMAASGSASFTLTPTDDAVDETNETIDVTGSLAGVTVTKATINLTDDDTRGVTVTGSPLTISEADDAETDAKENEGTYTVVLTSRPTASVTINLSAGVSAPVTLDRTSLTFAPDDWNTAQTVTVTGVDDAYDNAGDERAASIAHTFVAGTSDYGSVTVDPVSVTVNDDDTAPSAIALSVDADTGTDGVQTSVAENGGAKTVRVTATIAGDSRFPAETTVTVKVGASADSAREGTDYETVADRTITIAAGASSGFVDFTLTPKQDVVAEGAEAISLDGTSGTLDVTDAAISLTDDDAAPTGIALSAQPNTIGEADEETEITVTATVNGATRYKDAVTVAVSVGGGTATSATDYAAVANFEITIAAGEASATGTFDLTPTQDTLHEGTETIDVTGASGTLDVTKAVISLTDDDAAPSFAVADASAAEGDAVTFTVTRSGATGAAATVKWNTADDAADDANPATAGTDYTAVTTARTLSFAVGESTQTFTVATAGDSLHEGDETFLVQLTAATGGATIATGEATGTITDDDAAPTALTLTVDADTGTQGVQTSVAEDGGAKTVRVTATLGGTSTFTKATTVTVQVGKPTDSAREGTDYTTVADQNITIAAGASSGSVDFTLTPTQDVLHKGSESISLDGTSTGLTVTGTQLSLTDDDAAPSAITLTVDADTGTDGVQSSVAEGGGAKTVRVTATLSGNSRFPAAKTVVLAVGKATDSAKEGTDYTEVGAVSITIDANSASGSATFTLTPADDTIDDDAESLTVEGSVTGESGVTVSPVSIAIDDNDGAPTGIALSANPSTVAENAATAAKITITATVTGGTTFEAETTVAVTVGGADDTATSGEDYAAVKSFDIDIPAGATSATATFSLDPTDDAVAEGSETLTVSGESGDIDVESAEVTITDDEGTPDGDVRPLPRRHRRERQRQREHRHGDAEPRIQPRTSP